MTISFNSEMDLVNEIRKTDINLLTFSILLLDSVGVVLSKSAQSKIESNQRKREVEQKERDEWMAARGGTILGESDLPDWVEPAIKLSANLSVHAALCSAFGNIKPGTMFSSDIYQLPSEYIFTPDGLESIMYKFLLNGWITEKQYHKWQSNKK